MASLQLPLYIPMYLRNCATFDELAVGQKNFSTKMAGTNVGIRRICTMVSAQNANASSPNKQQANRIQP